YEYFFSEQPFDFGGIKASGAYAVRASRQGRVTIYEVVRGGPIELRLGQLRGTMSGQKLSNAWILLTRKRKVPLRFPDISQQGDVLKFGPPEMATVVGYEIDVKSWANHRTDA